MRLLAGLLMLVVMQPAVMRGGYVPPVVSPMLNLVGDGNSLMFNPGIAAGSDLMGTLGRMTTACMGRVVDDSRNFGVSGQTTDQMLSDAVAQIDSLIDESLTNVIFVWEHVNQRILAPSSMAYTLSSFRSYCQGRKQAGWTVFPLTNTATGWLNGSLDQPGIDWEETERHDANTDLRDPTAVGTYWDAIVDHAATTEINVRLMVESAPQDYPDLFDPAVTGNEGISYIHHTSEGAAWDARACLLRLAESVLDVTLTNTQKEVLFAIKHFWPFARFAAETTAVHPMPDSFGGFSLNRNGATTQDNYAISWATQDERGYVNPAFPALGCPDDFSLFGWLNADAFGAAATPIAGVTDGSNTDSVWRLKRETNGKFRLYYSPDDNFDVSNDFVQSEIVTTTGAWIFVECGRAAGTWFLSVNNETVVEVTDTAPTEEPASSFTALVIGSRDSASNWWQGSLRGWGIAYAKMTTAVRTYLYNGGVPRDSLFGD